MVSARMNKSAFLLLPGRRRRVDGGSCSSIYGSGGSSWLGRARRGEGDVLPLAFLSPGSVFAAVRSAPSSPWSSRGCFGAGAAGVSPASLAGRGGEGGSGSASLCAGLVGVSWWRCGLAGCSASAAGSEAGSAMAVLVHRAQFRHLTADGICGLLLMWRCSLSWVVGGLASSPPATASAA